MKEPEKGKHMNDRESVKYFKQLMTNRIRIYLAKHHDASPREVWSNEFNFQSSLNMVSTLMNKVKEG